MGAPYHNYTGLFHSSLKHYRASQIRLHSINLSSSDQFFVAGDSFRHSRSDSECDCVSWKERGRDGRSDGSSFTLDFTSAAASALFLAHAYARAPARGSVHPTLRTTRATHSADVTLLFSVIPKTHLAVKMSHSLLFPKCGQFLELSANWVSFLIS